MKILNKNPKNDIKIKIFNISNNIREKNNNLRDVSEKNINNNKVNINNNNSNENSLNLNNNSINVYIERKDKLNNLSSSKNINCIKFCNTNDINNKKVENNEKTEDSSKNKNVKNLNIITPTINKTITNYITQNNNPSYIKTLTNTIKYNNIFNINNNKFHKSFLIELNTIINNKRNNKYNNKKVNPNHSERYLFKKKVINTENLNNSNNIYKSYFNILNEKNKNSSNIKLDNYKVNSLNYNNIKNKNFTLVESPSYDSNTIESNNYYIKNIPLSCINNSIQYSIENDNKRKAIKGIYSKPFFTLSLPRQKNNKIKSYSQLNFKNNIYRNAHKNNIIPFRKKFIRISRSVNIDSYFNTSPTFYQKTEISNNIDSLKMFNSSNKSILISDYSIYNKYDNSKNEINAIDKNDCIINNLRETNTKTFCFFHKIYNYYIKPPKIEKCFFNKNNVKISMINVDINKKDKTQELNYNNDEEKNNESIQNGLIMTFGKMNNKKNNNLTNSDRKINNYNDKNVAKIIENSDLNLYRSLQQWSSNKCKSSKISNKLFHSLFSSEIDGLKYNESLEKEIYLNKNINLKLSKSKIERKINKNLKDKKSKTFNKEQKKNLENAEKGLKILRKIVLRRGKRGKIIDELIINNEISFDKDFIKSYKKKENIYLGTNKLNELFNNRKEIEINNNGKINDNIFFDKIKSKYCKSLNEDVIQGFSKMENVFEKNIVNNFGNESKEKKINTYEDQNKINYYSNSKEKKYYDIMNYSELLKTKIKTSIPKSNTNKGSSNENNTFDSYLECSKSINLKSHINKESEALQNKIITKAKNSNNSKESFSSIKCNLVNDKFFNYNKIDSNDNITIKLKESTNYLKEIRNKQSDNITKHDIIFLLNILVESNYSNILNQISKIILYRNNNILTNINDIIIYENLIKNIIFSHITKGTKHIFLYAKLCNDLNNIISTNFLELKNMANNKVKSLKFIINEECVYVHNNFKSINNNKNKENNEYYYLRKSIIGYVTFVYELINIKFLKIQFGFYILEEFYQIYNNNKLSNRISYLYLEGIIILLNKLGKLIFYKNNTKLIQNINNYIDNTLFSIIKNKDIINKIPNFLRSKIINLIEKSNNQWKSCLSEILIKDGINLSIPLKKEIKANTLKNNNKNNNDKSMNKEIKNEDINKAIIEEDLINYFSYFTDENNKAQINIKNYIDKSYNWKIIEELITNKNYGLETIIYYYILACTKLIDDNNKILISNDYIKNIIEYYANNLSKKSIDSIQNETIKIFLKVDEFINKNSNMLKIFGNLLYLLIDNKLFYIKYFNRYLKVERQTQINLAIITRYCIISSGKFAKKYFNDFKQTKLFINNEIFYKYVSNALKDFFYFIQ